MAIKLTFDRDGINLYPWCFAEECITKDISELFKFKVQKSILEFNNGRVSQYCDINDYYRLGEYLFDRIIKDQKFYKTVEKNVLKTGVELLDFCNKLPKDMKKLSNEKLAYIYRTYAQKTKKMRVWGWVPVLIDGAGIPFLSDLLQKKMNEHMIKIGMEDKTSEYYSILSSSDKMSEVRQEEIARLKVLVGLDHKIIELIKNKEIAELTTILRKQYPKVMDKINSHAKRFGWLTYAYSGPVMSDVDVLNLMKSSLNQKETVDAQVKRILNYYKNIDMEKIRLSKKLHLPKDVTYLYEVSSFFMYLKDMRKGIYQKSYVLMDPVIEEIARRSKLTFLETKYLNQDEVMQVLLEHKDLKKIATERTKYSVAIIEDGKTTVYIGDEARKIMKTNVHEELQDPTIKTLKEFKGSVAYSGKAKGIVKIILVKSDIPKLIEGDILVSSSTNPDLILAMKKAAAFITDMGGITSHAAIVSRELKKPCIVGTKIATKVLKDGDLVEVDATTGTVKILKN